MTQEQAVIQGTIFHIMIFEGIEKAMKEYPDYADFILDTMNSERFKKIADGMNNLQLPTNDTFNR